MLSWHRGCGRDRGDGRRRCRCRGCARMRSAVCCSQALLGRQPGDLRVALLCMLISNAAIAARRARGTRGRGIARRCGRGRVARCAARPVAASSRLLLGASAAGTIARHLVLSPAMNAPCRARRAHQLPLASVFSGRLAHAQRTHGSFLVQNWSQPSAAARARPDARRLSASVVHPRPPAVLARTAARAARSAALAVSPRACPSAVSAGRVSKTGPHSPALPTRAPPLPCCTPGSPDFCAAGPRAAMPTAGRVIRGRQRGARTRWRSRPASCTRHGRRLDQPPWPHGDALPRHHTHAVIPAPSTRTTNAPHTRSAHTLHTHIHVRGICVGRIAGAFETAKTYRHRFASRRFAPRRTSAQKLPTPAQPNPPHQARRPRALAASPATLP